MTLSPADLPAAASDLVFPRRDLKRERATLVAIVILMAYGGFAMSINGVAAPWIQKSFSLDQSGIARLYAYIALSAIGALALARMVDRMGRRRMLLICVALMPLSTAGAALSFSIVPFIVCEVALYALIGAVISGSMVMLAEELPIERRAAGQGYGGAAAAVGGGLCVFIMPFLVAHQVSWRVLLWAATGGIFLLPIMIRVMPESLRWEMEARGGPVRATHFYDVFKPLYRRRSVTLIVCTFFTTIAVTAALGWSYFHAVSVVHLSATSATMMTLGGGALGMAGFPAGAWAAERFGRVPTVVCFGVVLAIGALWFYWGPPSHFGWPAVWLGAGYSWLMASNNASQVAATAAITELFPTALRGTMVGWFAFMMSIGQVASQTTISFLAHPLGGLSVVVGYLAILAAPSAILFGLMIDETRGLALEESAQEELFRPRA